MRWVLGTPEKAKIAELNLAVFLFICSTTTIFLASRFFKSRHGPHWMKGIKGSGLEYVNYKQHRHLIAQILEGSFHRGTVDTRLTPKPMKYNPLKFMGLPLILQVNDDYLANDEIIFSTGARPTANVYIALELLGRQTGHQCYSTGKPDRGFKAAVPNEVRRCWVKPIGSRQWTINTQFFIIFPTVFVKGKIEIQGKIWCIWAIL